MEVRSIETIVKALNDAHVQYLNVGGLAVIVSYDTLLQLKKSAGRPQDLADIEKLHKLDPHRKQP